MKLLVFWAAVIFGLAFAEDYTCSASAPCKIGCCSKGGYCGFGPTFCGSGNCTSSCNAKSECDPGWGAQWSQASSCPLNVCCSQYGFCGTTSDFCGNKTVTSPSCSGTSANNRVVGYYEGWSVTRPCDQMWPEDVHTSAYTHLNFAFAYIDPVSFKVAPMSAGDVDLYDRFTGLKQSNPGLQTWISIGGWSMNDADQPTASTFSNLAGSASAQQAFFSSLLQFMITYGFDGVDIDWEYPVAAERSGVAADFANYVSFLKNLRQALGSSGHSYGLTITIPSSYWYLQHFDIVNIEPLVDWFNVMTYDLHGTWDSTDPSIGPHVYAHTNLTEIDQTMNLLWRSKINPSKVTMGLGYYGRSFTLTNPSCTSAGCAFSSGGNPGRCTQNSGTLSYPEIQRIIAAGNATVTLDQKAAVKQVVWDKNQWVSYDDDQTFRMKQAYANSKCLGGTMTWAVSLDSSNGSAGSLLGSITGQQSKSLVQGVKGSVDTVSTCVWSECGASCPAGTSPVAGGGSHPQNSNVGIWQTGCSGTTTRSFCCPNNDKPTCTWRGRGPFCNEKCQSDEIQVATDWSGGGFECWTGHKNLCCTGTTSVANNANCTWAGQSPFCAGFGKTASCPSGQSALTWDTVGSGGDQPCLTGQKSFCCTQPAPYANCAWYSTDGFYGYLTRDCSAPCPSGQYAVAVDPSFCLSGASKFCCDVPASTDSPQLASFKSQLQAFASQPTCAAELFSKRDATADDSRVETVHVGGSKHDQGGWMPKAVRDLEKRASSALSASSLVALFQALLRVFSGGPQTSTSLAEEQLYNQILKPVWGATPSAIANYLGAFPDEDPLSILYELGCNGGNVSEVLQDVQDDSATLCVPIPSTSGSNKAKRDVLHDDNLTATLELGDATRWADGAVPHGRLVSRVISSSKDTSLIGPGQQPSYLNLLLAAANGEFTFQYTSLQRLEYERPWRSAIMTEPADQLDGIIELAWLMAPDNDVSRVPPEFQEFTRDGPPGRSGRPAPPDLFFVLHLHVDHLLTERGSTFVGVYAVNVFHGQYVNGQNRVDGNSNNVGQERTRNSRANLMSCESYQSPMGDNTYWYPGRQVSETSPLARFGNYLVRFGLLTPELFTNIATRTIPGWDNIRFFDWARLQDQDRTPRDEDGGPYTPPPGEQET